MRTLCLFIFAFQLTGQLFTQTLNVSIGFPEDNIVFKLVDKWLSETGELAGIKFKIHYLPFARAEKELINGTIDGDIGRTSFVYEGDKRVIYTGFPILTTNYITYTVKDNIDPTDIIQLRRLRLIVNMGNKAMTRWTEEKHYQYHIHKKYKNSIQYVTGKKS